MGNLYREDILSQAGGNGEPPATWDDYYDLREAVRSKTGSYISSPVADEAGMVLGFFWQAGAKPFSYDGQETVRSMSTASRPRW